MEYMERKIEKIIRRVSSKSRRSARRARHVADESSSCSDLEDRSPSATPKVERKNTSIRRVNQKSSNSSKLILSSSDKLKECLFTFRTQPVKISFFHLWLASAAYQIREYLRTVSERSSNSSQRPRKSDFFLCSPILKREKAKDEASTAFFPLIKSSKQSCRNEEDVKQLPSKVDKACESEDAEYVSDYSSYSRPRKSLNELDMSMDESVAESSGRESGYLSGIDLSFLSRNCPSAGDSPAVSPQGTTFLRDRIILFHPLKLKSFTHGTVDAAVMSTSAPVLYVPRLSISAGDLLKDNSEVPDYISTALFLRENIAETKYVTAIFEMTVGGIGPLIGDVLDELNMWFGEQIGLMGIACEVQWSVPEKHRNRASEIRMKEAVHMSLRQNNRRVLDLKNNIQTHLPLTLASATTEENCGRDCSLNCFQGIYRRFYKSLLPYQHSETGEWHKPYWSFEKSSNGRGPPVPNPSQFIFGSNPTQLNIGSLIAVNVVALKIAN